MTSMPLEYSLGIGAAIGVVTLGPWYGAEIIGLPPMAGAVAASVACFGGGLLFAGLLSNLTTLRQVAAAVRRKFIWALMLAVLPGLVAGLWLKDCDLQHQPSPAWFFVGDIIWLVGAWFPLLAASRRGPSE